MTKTTTTEVTATDVLQFVEYLRTLKIFCEPGMEREKNGYAHALNCVEAGIRTAMLGLYPVNPNESGWFTPEELESMILWDKCKS